MKSSASHFCILLVGAATDLRIIIMDNMRHHPLTNGPALRHQAEDLLRQTPGVAAPEAEAALPQPVRQVLRDLRSYQINLELQTEELRRLQFALEASRSRYFDWLDPVPVGIISLSVSGLVLEANVAAAALLGVLRGSLFGQRFDRFVLGDDVERYWSLCQRLLETGQPQASELRLLRSDGLTCWVRTTALAAQEQTGPTALRLVLGDVTDRKQAEARLIESENHLRTIIENEPACIKIVDAEGLLRMMNPAGLAMIEADSAEQVLGHPVLGLIAPDHRQAFADLHAQVLAGSSGQLEFEVVGLKGGRRWLETHAAPMQYEGRTVHLAVTRDVTERRRVADKLQLAASVFTHAHEGILITDTHGDILDVNAAFTRITGYLLDEVHGRHSRLLKSDRHDFSFYTEMLGQLRMQGHWSGEIWIRHKNGLVFPARLTISAVYGAQGEVQQYVALFSDITVFKAHQHQLERLAHYDALTGLPNRALLVDRLQQAMSQALRCGQLLALVYLDLDGFKCVNDSHGHDAGDAVLVAAASRMTEVLREGDTLARIGGDEFVALLPGQADRLACLPTLARLLGAAAQPLLFREQALRVSASLGVAIFPQQAQLGVEQLLRQADQAMYLAKQAGKNRYCFFGDAEPESAPKRPPTAAACIETPAPTRS